MTNVLVADVAGERDETSGILLANRLNQLIYKRLALLLVTAAFVEEGVDDDGRVIVARTHHLARLLHL